MFNCVELSKAMLASLEKTVDLHEHEVILVDDASNDGTPEFLSSLKNRYRVFRNEQNGGFAVSNNLGAKQAKGDILVFLNNDLVLLPNWLQPMLDLIQSQKDVGTVGNIQLNFETRLVDHAGIFFDLEGMPTHARKTRKRLPRGDWLERNAVTAACLMISKAKFQEMNGFDEDYRNGMEDVDLSVRMKRKGYRHFVSHKSVILHHISKSPGRHKNNEKNSDLFRKRWSAYTKTFGVSEWPKEYLRRYARYWWRMEPRKFAQALAMLLFPSNTK